MSRQVGDARTCLVSVSLVRSNNDLEMFPKARGFGMVGYLKVVLG